jgi:hypothetical protein
MNLFGEAEKIMKNKYFLYFVVVLAGSNLLGYINTSEWNAAIFFVAISGVIFYYTKNVPLALIIAVFATSFFMAIVYKTREGLDNMEEDTMDDKLENLDKELKEGMDALKSTDGDVDKAKEIIKKYSEKDKENVVMPLNETEMEDIEINENSPEPFSTLCSKKQGFQNFEGYLDSAAPLDQDYDNMGQNLSQKVKQESSKLMLHKNNVDKHISTMNNTANNLLTGFDIMQFGKYVTELATDVVPL